jgi:hypothetical protein
MALSISPDYCGAAGVAGAAGAVVEPVLGAVVEVLLPALEPGEFIGRSVCVVVLLVVLTSRPPPS